MVALVAAIGLVVGAGTAGGAVKPAPVYTPPPRELSPFTSADSFCSRDKNQFEGVKANDPRLTASKITVVMLTPKTNPAEIAANPGLKLGDPVEEAQTFAALVNQCGGIGGQKIDFHVLVESGDPLGDCLNATQGLHAFIVVAWSSSPAASCIAKDERTIMVTLSNVSNDALMGTQGRLVATGSTEGVLQARILDLISSGRLAGKRVAIVTGTGPTDAAFAQTASALLVANHIPIVSRAGADVLFQPKIDSSALPLPAQNTATTARTAPLDVYGFADATDQTIEQSNQAGVASAAQPSYPANLYSFIPVEDEQGRLGQSSGTFTTMCNKAYAAARGNAAVDLPAPFPPATSDVPYIQVAKICLAMRIVARGLFNAGVAPTQQAVVAALYRLPYIENELPDDSPKPRPNQIVNEPVTRVEQVVVLGKAESPCALSAPPKATSNRAACWAPVAGWDHGGHAVNAPLPASTNPRRPQRSGG